MYLSGILKTWRTQERLNVAIFIPLGSLFFFPADNTPLRSSLVAEANVVELFREEPEEELGIRIVGGKDTPLGNIVIQEIVRDSLAARDGRLAPGDHILEVRGTLVHKVQLPWVWNFNLVIFLHKQFVIMFFMTL